MVNNNKILTVSYGTFSCTLEGFDDSFGTMKVIAEYFRDLAAHDRYFGAEPPQPDADVLARIAEREISRPVEARETDRGIVLSADAGHAHPEDASRAAASRQRAVSPTGDEPVVHETASENDQHAAVTQEHVESVAQDVPPAPESIAAKLQRIRSVVSKSKAEATDEDLFEDEHSDSLASGPDASLLLTKTVTDGAVTQTGAPQQNVKETTPDAEATGETHKEVPQSAESNIPDPTNDDGDKDMQASLTQGDTDSDAQADERPADIPVAHENTVSETTDKTRKREPRAHVMKVKRADIDAALKNGALEAIAENAQTSTLSEADEAELLAELAQVEAEFSKDNAQQTQENASEAPIKDVAAPLSVDDDLSRLMAEADNQMGEPEGVRRRNAFAHLKAAVMAKKADTGGDQKTEAEGVLDQPDVEAVVDPRHVETQPDRQRPAPLRLVAEQRVDNLADGSPNAPEPSRTEGTLIDTIEINADVSFEDFATKMDAHDLPDLIEAAASYISFVEGHEGFWRRRVIRLVHQVQKESFSREDTLRCFGELIRDGKIKKNGHGRFTVSSKTSYRPDERAAG